jgi:polyisoprenoid-binding protein YceI
MTTIPSGTWLIDPTHSEVSFTVKHLMVSKVRGRFALANGKAVTGAALTDTKLEVELDASTVATGEDNRDQHLRGEDFFDVEKFPKISFVSTRVETTKDDDVVLLHGDLTIRDVTAPAVFTVEIGGVAVDPYGQTKAAVEASTSISRGAFGLTWNTTLETGGVLVSDEVKLTVDAQAVLQA